MEQFNLRRGYRFMMKNASGILLCWVTAFLVLFSSLVHAEMTRDELAAETEAYCATTANEKATPEIVMKKVKEAADSVNAEGSASFSKFMGKGSEFIFGGTYIWINSFDCVMVMHPIKSKMEGKSLLAMTDKNGELFFTDFVKTAKEGGGWVQYSWPKPGEKNSSLKVSYVLPAKLDGKDVVVGAGIYDVSPEELQKLNVK
jgi:methyl-accepting chemotaxis protein